MLSACCNGFVAYNEVLLGIFQDKVCQNRPISFQNRPIIKHLGRQTLSYVLPCCVFLLRYRWQVQLHSCCHTCCCGYPMSDRISRRWNASLTVDKKKHTHQHIQLRTNNDWNDGTYRKDSTIGTSWFVDVSETVISTLGRGGRSITTEFTATSWGLVAYRVRCGQTRIDHGNCVLRLVNRLHLCLESWFWWRGMEGGIASSLVLSWWGRCNRTWYRYWGNDIRLCCWFDVR